MLEVLCPREFNLFIDSFGNSYSNSKISPSVHTLGDSTADLYNSRVCSIKSVVCFENSYEGNASCEKC